MINWHRGVKNFWYENLRKNRSHIRKNALTLQHRLLSLAGKNLVTRSFYVVKTLLLLSLVLLLNKCRGPGSEPVCLCLSTVFFWLAYTLPSSLSFSIQLHLQYSFPFLVFLPFYSGIFPFFSGIFPLLFWYFSPPVLVFFLARYLFGLPSIAENYLQTFYLPPRAMCGIKTYFIFCFKGSVSRVFHSLISFTN